MIEATDSNIESDIIVFFTRDVAVFYFFIINNKKIIIFIRDDSIF